MMYKNFEYVVNCLENDHTVGKKVQFDERQKKQFVVDLHYFVSVMRKYYAENMAALVQEQKAFFQKFELIAQYSPDLLQEDFFCDWIDDILAAGELPHPLVYYNAGLISVESMAAAVTAYLDEKEVQTWTLEHWDYCRLFAPVIYNTLKKQNIDAPLLKKISNNHYGTKALIVFVLLIVVAILGFKDCINGSVFLLLLIFIIGFNELVFLCYGKFFSAKKKVQ